MLTFNFYPVKSVVKAYLYCEYSVCIGKVSENRKLNIFNILSFLSGIKRFCRRLTECNGWNIGICLAASQLTSSQNTFLNISQHRNFIHSEQQINCTSPPALEAGCHRTSDLATIQLLEQGVRAE